MKKIKVRKYQDWSRSHARVKAVEVTWIEPPDYWPIETGNLSFIPIINTWMLLLKDWTRLEIGHFWTDTATCRSRVVTLSRLSVRRWKTRTHVCPHQTLRCLHRDYVCLRSYLKWFLQTDEAFLVVSNTQTRFWMLFLLIDWNSVLKNILKKRGYFQFLYKYQQVIDLTDYLTCHNSGYLEQ